MPPRCRAPRPSSAPGGSSEGGGPPCVRGSAAGRGEVRPDLVLELSEGELTSDDFPEDARERINIRLFVVGKPEDDLRREPVDALGQPHP